MPVLLVGSQAGCEAAGAKRPEDRFRLSQQFAPLGSGEFPAREPSHLVHDFTALTARHTGAIATAIEADTAAATPSDISQPTAKISIFLFCLKMWTLRGAIRCGP